jgi:small subunit ribosomal protein S17
MAQVRRKILVGQITSDKMENTVVVRVERTKRHPIYGKVVRLHDKYKAHDSENQCKVGDLVEIIESQPISKEKRWVVSKIIEKAG